MEVQASESKYLESQGVGQQQPVPQGGQYPPTQQPYQYNPNAAGYDQPPPPPAGYGAALPAGYGASAPPPLQPSPDSPDAGCCTPNQGPKKVVDAYILCLVLGFFGAHHFYLRRYGFGILYLFTFGLLGMGYVFDMCRMHCLVKDANDKINNPEKRKIKNLADSYVLWFPCGLFGFHHFYLGRVGWGLLYLFTVGLFGIGWLVDGCRMVLLVKHANQKQQGEVQHKDPAVFRELTDVYILTLCPITGLLGVQHYYLHRIGFGLFYTFTCGGFGVGYLLDVFRMSFLVKDVNNKKIDGDNGRKRLDDCYQLCFPLGFLGLHHFYLKRPCWGILYLFTVGCFGIGWLIDWFRLPCLVADYNRNLKNPLIVCPPTQPGSTTTVIIASAAGPLPPSQGVTNMAAGQYQPPQGAYPYPPQQGNYPGAYAPRQDTPYPQQQMYPNLPPGMYQQQQPPPQYQPVSNYGTAGETSWSTINSSDFDQPPSYDVSQTDVQLDNEQNQKREAPTAPPDDKY